MDIGRHEIGRFSPWIHLISNRAPSLYFHGRSSINRTIQCGCTCQIHAFLETDATKGIKMNAKIQIDSQFPTKICPLSTPTLRYQIIFVDRHRRSWYVERTKLEVTKRFLPPLHAIAVGVVLVAVMRRDVRW